MPCANFCTCTTNGICGLAGVFSEEAAASDPQPCSVSEFPSAAARLIGLPEPHYILFTADPDPETGVPWCPDCARCLGGALSRVAEVGGTLLEVQVQHFHQKGLWVFCDG